ncbi:glycosyltransferase family 4 protein [Mucilaginibacter sp.]|uniref:glycosyltransferase family 4 protein n=1 Tax=Mucilaginibacter sp. TaxID=1882438 RepID=UPI003D106C26
MLNVLYVFGGEKASGAEKVIQRLVVQNINGVNAHLFISPGGFAQSLIDDPDTAFSKITLLNQLKKLNRSSTSKLRFYLLGLSNYFSVSFIVLRYISKHKINVVHANTIVPASYLLPAIWFSKICYPKVKWVWSDHDLKYFSSLDHKISSLCVKAYDLTLAVSNAVKKKYQTQNTKVVVLYNGLNLNEFKKDDILRENFRNNLAVSGQTIVIGLAGTIEPRKGQLALIKAFEAINREFTDCRLLLAGVPSADHPAYMDEVLNYAGKNKPVTYIGKINDMPAFYNACDILINNSNSDGSEPLGTTIYEAMACEKIVAASNTGGTAEIIDDKVNGYLFEPDNEASIYQTLKYIITHINDQQKVTTKAREKVAGRFNIASMAANYNLFFTSNKN